MTESANPQPLVSAGIGQHLLCTLAKLGQVSARISEDHLLEHGLRIRHYSVLQLLELDGPQSQFQLVNALRLDAATMVTTIDDLEAQGLATRTKDPADRRRHVVDLTNKGRRLLSAVSTQLDALEAEVLGDVPPAVLRRLEAALGKLNESALLLEAYDATRRR